MLQIANCDLLRVIIWTKPVVYYSKLLRVSM